MKPTFEHCPTCGTKGTLALRVEPLAFKFGERDVKLDAVECFVCSNCGDGFFSADQSDALEHAAKEQIVREQS